ncbi:GntR family transcriptional regulator [Streptomyces lunaelactis]|uniref:GntR family transcriptional regulator n=2 Tax=Streptomyces TaxID=1883 RepID=A0A2R4T0Z7_9ACTN|nr:GntR family transcriptional regulator [Streptomyces lunaelactis]AVZ72774.1 GntR family transcriptional regulator [Streptomyces lunaelactis]NUK89301.1 GntR family transcriptional regulator [Streptomyces lunaelactis]
MTQPAPSRRHAIAEDLRNQISTGLLKAGARLPSEAQLAAHYAVSTPTLRNALALLQGEGLVEKIHGSGNFVRHPVRRITYAGGGRTPCADDALRTTVRTTRLRAHGHLTALLKVRSRSPLTEFLCLSHEGKSPHSLTRIYVPRDLAPPGTPGGSLAAHLADLRPPLATVQETVSTRLPTPDEATTLRISATLAVLSITRVATAITGRVVEVALLVLPGDRADAIFTTHYPTAPRRADA